MGPLLYGQICLWQRISGEKYAGLRKVGLFPPAAYKTGILEGLEGGEDRERGIFGEVWGAGKR